VPSAAACISRLVSLLMLLFLWLSLSAAQEPSLVASDKASISGKVTDQAGAIVSGAKAAITSSSGVRLAIPVNAQGMYFISGLYPGTYTLTVSADNFGDTVFENITLTPGKKLTIDARLKPASAIPMFQAGGAEQGETSRSPQGVEKISGGGGAVRGTVTDLTGAVVSDAKAVLTSETGEKVAVPVNDKGVYSFTRLKPGAYKLIVTAPNFADTSFDNVNVMPGMELTLDASLAPANAKREEVNVESGGVGQVETETSAVSGTITQKEVVSIPLNGRNFTQLIALAPGVSNQSGGEGADEAKVGVVGSVKYSVNGGRVEYNTFEVDGSDVLNTGLNGSASTLMVYPSEDAIQEVKVLTSNYGAQYGRTASGTVQVTTKSGTPQWHGNLYDFVRNEAFNSRNFFDVVYTEPPILGQTTPGPTFGTKAPLYRRQDFGGTIGGPLYIPGVFNTKKDKTFFFYSEEFRLEKTPTEYNQAVPGLKERGLTLNAGVVQKNLQMNAFGVVYQDFDFSDVCPFNGGTGPLYRSQYPDCPAIPISSGALEPINSDHLEQAVPPGSVATYGVDKNAIAILDSNLIPLPNAPLGCNISITNYNPASPDPNDPNRCYDQAVSPSTYWREELFRIDHILTDKLKITFRYVHDGWDTSVLTPQWGEVRNTFPTVQNRFFGPGVSLVARLTHTISPTLLNDIEVGYVNSGIILRDQNGPGRAVFQRNPTLDQPLVQDPGAPGQCNPAFSVDPATGLSECAIGYIFNNGFGGKMPGINLLGTNAAYGGRGFAVDPSYMPWGHTSPTYSVRDDVGKALGKHTLTFGAQYVYYQRNQTNNAIGAASGDEQGLLTFSNLANSTGNAFADFLVESQYPGQPETGFIQSFTQDSTQGRYYQRYRIAEPYLQDDWKIAHNLTLNVGLRISLFGTYSEKNRNAWNWEATRYKPNQFTVDPVYGELLSSGSVVPVSALVPSDPAGIVGALGLVRCGYDGTPASCMKGHLFNPAPRVGFAWDPWGDGKTSIRGGYGIFFEHGTGNEANTGSLEASAPVVLSLTQPLPLNYTCIGDIGYGAAFGGNADCTRFEGVAVPPVGSAFPLDVASIPTKATWPYAQQWSFGMQRELPNSFVANIAYVGSKGTKLTIQRQINQLPPLPANQNPFGPNEPLTHTDCTVLPGGNAAAPQDAPGDGIHSFQLEDGTQVTPQSPAYMYLQAACANLYTPNVNSLAGHPYPGLGRILSLQNVADSTYHALQGTLRHTSNGLTLGVSYSYSHSIDDASDRSDPVLVNSYDLSENKASSNFDERHLASVSYVYQLPLKNFPRNFIDLIEERESRDADAPPSAGCCSTLVNQVLDGWELSGVTLFQSGTPFSVINSAGNTGISLTDNAGVDSGLGISNSIPVSYPDVMKGLPPPGNNSQSFGPLIGNPSQFVAPRGLTFGDAGRNYLNNPRRINFDMALLKHFKIRESRTLEFRAEGFNIFNHTQFRIYDPDNPGPPGNNVISCYAGPLYSAGFKGSGADCVTGASFLHPLNAHRPRTLQFGLKLGF
jgi:hypothetical protein